MPIEIKKCRICGNTDLAPILSLGDQSLTGVFPKSKEMRVTSGPLELTKCVDENNAAACGLVQLRHSYDHTEMYGNNYGYRSGLNKSMVNHLCGKVEKIEAFVQPQKGDLVIDIGSNDSTLLRAYREQGLSLVGIDPSGEKFKKYYPEHVRLIPEFFSAEAVRKNIGDKKAKIVTSIAMFYDLESPKNFAQQISDILAEDGVWVFEQSYLPTMLEMNAYDTVCHEHLEYYCLKQIKWILDAVGMKIVDVEFNDVNGGSFSVLAAKQGSKYAEKTVLVQSILAEENKKALNTLVPYKDFARRVLAHRDEILKFIKHVRSEKKTILGYGASTKGNVVLQYCNMSTLDLPCIAEVNPDKFGCCTPGTNIPIVSEETAKGMRPDYFMVLPWHFRDNIIQRESEYLKSGGKLVFPLPVLEVV